MPHIVVGNHFFIFIMYYHMRVESWAQLLRRISYALQFQSTLALGFLFCLVVSYFYVFQADPRFPTEQPWLLWVGFFLSAGCAAIGYWMRPKEVVTWTNLTRWVQIVFLAWMIACVISAIVFVFAGFPDPSHIESYSLWRRFVDGLFESMSWFTTAWGSILPSVEAFPRGILMWRSTTHFLGGMGIAYMAITFFQSLRLNRAEIVNAEAEGPNIVKYDNDKEAIQSGLDFFKAYGGITLICIILLIISGLYFRITPYAEWYDAIFDAINYAFSAMGTGWFGTYDTSAGLFLTENGQQIIGGLRNPMSEWILAIFMIVAGANFGLWYELMFYARTKQFFKNVEFKTYIGTVFILVAGIMYFWMQVQPDLAFWDAARWAFFSVASIISTTGLANYDWATRPVASIAFLMVAYFTGSCVGSTAGWLKFQRFTVAVKYGWLQIKNLVNNRHDHDFELDGVKYTGNHAATILLNLVVYFVVFLLGGTMLIMIVNQTLTLVDGSTLANNFTTAFGAAIANLGNIGPVFQLDWVNHGPTGNYFAFNEAAKLIMYFLMYFGRVWVLSIIFLFVAYKQPSQLDDSFASVEFEEGKEGGAHLKK
jgi:trk system potassium uptake protein